MNRLIIQLLASSPLLVAGFNKPQKRLTIAFTNFEARIMDQWGNGGGKWATISGDSQHPFQGRTFGGAKRYEIRGTRKFGSGYPYGASNQSTIADRPFPFGVWPLYWDQNFMDADEYGPRYDVLRPGGFVASVPLRTTTDHFNVTEDEVYYAVGDRESLLPLMISYVTWCHATPAWPSRFNASATDAPIKLENVIQYFRASSFALASPAYNNTLARTSKSDTKDNTPLPEFMEYSTFRKCVDDVTENALAIVNTIPGPTPLDMFVDALNVGGIFICGGMLFCLLVIGGILVTIRAVCQTLLYGDPDTIARARQERRNELVYENHP
ncbi:hypothetical protein FRC18_001498 [Serendipita sp. 400]|nr:hypothetical protein FRC18_001498 [Serendipita sp. 400]